MHEAVRQWVATHRPDVVGDVLDVGGRHINGDVRDLLTDVSSWTVIDLIDAPDVDIVGDITTAALVGVADTVLCLEVLEHAERWRDIVAACVAAARMGGAVIVTAAGPSRAPHSATDGGQLRPGEWYEPITIDDLEDALTDLDPLVVDELGADVRAMGVKP